MMGLAEHGISVTKQQFREKDVTDKSIKKFNINSFSNNLM